MKTELDLAGLNHFLRVAIGGWDWIIVNDQKDRDYLYPIIKQLDPSEIFWHIEEDYIWKVDPWQSSQKKIAELHERRIKDQIELDERKKVKDELVTAIIRKFNCDKQQAELMAVEFVRRGATQCAEVFGVDISCLGGELKPHTVLEEGRKVDEY